MTELKLRECPFCDGADRELDECGYDDEYSEGVYLELEWSDGKPRITAAGYYDGGYCCGCAHADIEFCPFCGRRLVADE